MIHLAPPTASQPTAQPYAEAVARLASIRHALRLVDSFGGGPAPDIEDDGLIAAAWPEASQARRRCFDRKSERLVGSAAAGIEALVATQAAGREPHAEASRALSDEIRRGLADVSRLLLP